VIVCDEFRRIWVKGIFMVIVVYKDMNDLRAKTLGQ
jgi:hypothetical protein